MSDEYTPTTAEVKHLCARAMQTELDQRYAQSEAEFDRWLAEHDRATVAKALEDFATDTRAHWAPHTCPWVGAVDDRATWVREGRS